jgi:hypothetical protein
MDVVVVGTDNQMYWYGKDGNNVVSSWGPVGTLSGGFIAAP